MTAKGKGCVLNLAPMMRTGWGMAGYARLKAAREAVEEVTAGRPCLGVSVRVVRADGSDVKPGSGEIGEILIAGEHILTEYWERPDATAEAIRDGWFHTGDLATVDEEGYVF